MSTPPSGTVTFLFTDVVRSTEAWESAPEAMSAALERHNELLGAIIRSHGGYVFKTVGDAFCSAFENAAQAVEAAIEAQLALSREPWEDTRLQVRMAIHTGSPELRTGDYFGLDLSRVSRLAGAGYGGQVLLSGAAAALAADRLPPGASLIDLHEHRLRDLSQPEHVFMVVAPGMEVEFPPLRTLAAPPHNLVAPLTSLVGREDEIARVCAALLGGRRLVTLTGPGGVGKTRIAVEAARRLLDDFGDGVWLIDMAPLTSGEMVPATVASVLRLREALPGDEIGAIGRHMEEKAVLLVLDNCEHVRAACGGFAATLLALAPDLRVLATSREALAVTGEEVQAVAPLGLPPLDEPTSPEALETYPALKLLSERAGLVRTGFAITGANADTVVSICRRLDALPLAIELAASRFSSMTPNEVLARITDRFPALGRSDPSRAHRQETLQALIEWSSQLLDSQQRTLFQRLSVFAGGWDVAAAAAVCGSPGELEGEVADCLSELVEKSLVVFEDNEGVGRYRYLDTIRAYARERLTESGESEEIEQRHREWCLQLATAADANVRGPDQVLWLSRLAIEVPNLRAALASCLQSDVATGLALGGRLFRFWWLHGLLAEGRRWLDEFLRASSAPDEARALVLFGAGILAHGQADYPAALRSFTEALGTYQALGNELGEADSLTGLANVAWRQGDPAAAAGLHRQGLAICRAAGDNNRMAASLNNLGLALVDAGDYDSARAAYEESLEIRQRIGDEIGALTALHNLGIVFAHAGEPSRALEIQGAIIETARRLGDKRAVVSALLEVGRLSLDAGSAADAARAYGEALELSEEIDDQVRTIQAVEGLGMVAVDARQWELAGVLTGAAATRRTRLGAPMTPADLDFTGKRMEALRKALGERRMTEAQRQGTGMARLDGIVGRLLDALESEAQGKPGARAEPGGQVSGITPREAEILGLVALGLTNQEIAERLVVSVRTVETHLGNVYGKIGVRGRAEAAAFAVRAGLANARGE